MVLKAPFPWFGGKSRVAGIVWRHFGDVKNYVEPFYGSGAVLLNRPGGHRGRVETANDYDGYVSNFWRALQAAPDEVAKYADWPVNENDLHARHIWLIGQRDKLRPRLEGDPDFYDAKIAGWWVWGVCAWIGSGFCSGSGPWHSIEGKLVHLGDNGRGINRKLVHLGNNGQGINRQLVHLGDNGQGINRQRQHLGNEAGGMGIHKLAARDGLRDWFNALANRLRYVRFTCGDWSRVCGPSVTFKHGLTGVFLDPPYGDGANRTADIYRVDSGSIANNVRQWCINNGDNSRLRIALCGYADEGHEQLETAGWSVHEWATAGGFGSQGNGQGKDNRHRERIWFSPHCLGRFDALPLFAGTEVT